MGGCPYFSNFLVMIFLFFNVVSYSYCSGFLHKNKRGAYVL